MRKQFFDKRLPLLLSLLAFCTSLPCFGQNNKEPEENIPKELRNRVDVAVIQEKLRFLRKNESILGENHLNKKAIQSEIREYELDLKCIVDRHKSMPTKAGTSEGNTNFENTLPPELAAREDVLPIIRKLKFLRMNNKYLGDNHPSKKGTEEQIRGHEFALYKILYEDPSQTRKLLKAEQTDNLNTLSPQELENRRELRVTIQKLDVLKTNQANYGENHPNWKIIQAEIREHESKLRELGLVTRLSF